MVHILIANSIFGLRYKQTQTSCLRVNLWIDFVEVSIKQEIDIKSFTATKTEVEKLITHFLKTTEWIYRLSRVIPC